MTTPKRKTSLLGACLLCIAIDAAMAMNSEERLLFANGLYRRGMFELAIPEYQMLMTNDAALHMQDLAAFRLGECYRSLNRNEEAAQAFERVVEEYPQSLFMQRAAFRRAEIDMLEGRLLQAAKRFEKVLQLKPPDDIEAASLYFLGVSQSGMDRFADAEKNFRRMLKRHPRSPYADYARMALIDLLDKKGESTAAMMEFLDQVIKQPETPALGAEALARAGLLAYRDRDMAQAALYFTKLSVDYPKDAWVEKVRLEATWSYLMDQQHEKARIAARDGLNAATPQQRPEWLYLLANIERRAKLPQEAEPWYTELLTTAPDHALAPLAAYEACSLAFQAGQYERVLALVDRAGVDPERELSRVWMKASALRALERNQDAEKLYDAILRDFADSEYAATAAYQKAMLLEERGEWLAAAQAFKAVATSYATNTLASDALMAAATSFVRVEQPEDAIAAWRIIDRDYPNFHLMDEVLMGWTRAEMDAGRLDVAVTNLHKLITVHTNSRLMAEANYLRGTIYEKNEQMEEAEFHYRRALTQKPSPALTRQIQHRRVAVLQRQGRNEEAAGLMNQLLLDGAGHQLPSPLIEWLARWNLEQKQMDAAERAARRLWESGESDSWKQIGAFIVGRAALEQNKRSESEAAFRAAATFGLNTRETVEAYFQLGLMAMQQIKPEVAIDSFLQALERSSSDALIDIRARSYLQLGIAHEAMSNWSEAGRYYMGGAVLFDDPVITSESLYRAAGALHAQQKQVERDRVVAELLQRYPESDWSTQAEERWRSPATP